MFCPPRGMCYALLQTYVLCYAIPHLPTWWTNRAMCYKGLCIIRGMCYEGFNCTIFGVVPDYVVSPVNLGSAKKKTPHIYFQSQCPLGIIKKNLKRSFHWHPSSKCSNGCFQEDRNWRGMKTPIREPGDGRSQPNPAGADKTGIQKESCSMLLERANKVHISMYEIPITGLESKLI